MLCMLTPGLNSFFKTVEFKDYIAKVDTLQLKKYFKLD